MPVQIGSAPDSWGVWFPSDPRQLPWQRFLDEVAEAGYRWIELGPLGYLPTDPAVLRRELAARGLGVTAGFVDGALHDPAAWPDLERRALAMADLVVAVDGGFLVLMTATYVDHFTEPLRHVGLAPDDWRRLVDATQRLAALVRDRAGLRLVFHPHAGMYVETEAEIEALLAATDPTLVTLCFDTGQHIIAGGDPLAFLRRHHARVPYLHLKNIDPAVLARVRAGDLPMNAAVPYGLYCEPDRGLVDMPALFAFLREIAFDGWAIVEQDLFPTDFDRPLPIARRSRVYLERLLAGPIAPPDRGAR
ncbi:MAG: TIM barrel protein [Chloroflexi bacterium]|nr:TIM barrel protein [Chloroflexota bacterium]